MRRLLTYLAALLTLGLLAAGWYAYDKGFTRKWRTYVAREFRKRGVELWMSRLTLDPLRGIIAKNVQVFDGKDKRRTVAVIDEMRLMINWANFVRGRPFVDALDLTDASLSLPIDPREPRGQKFEVSGLSGKLRLPPQQIYLSRLETNLYGMRVTASGRLINPEKFSQTDLGQAIDREQWLRLAGKVAALLQAIRFSGPPPEVHLRFSGDLAQPQLLFAELNVRASQVHYRDIKLRSLNAAAVFRDGRVEVKQFAATDGRGTLHVSAEYDVAEQSLTAQLRSSINPMPLVRSLTPLKLELEFEDPPMLELTARANFRQSPQVKLVAHVNTGIFTYRAVRFDYALADFSTDGRRWSLRDALLATATGQVEGDIVCTTDEVRSQLTSSIPPSVLRPLFDGPAEPWLARVAFVEAAPTP
ncbi:MAG: hypothetical protein ABI680_09725 [Chthoniobacteraceae bacterium]